MLAAPAGAHGPSLQASFSGFRPQRLEIAAGDTVHFRRASGSQVALTVVSDSGLFESASLDAEGWHHTFDLPGEYGVHLAENPSARARIRVGPPRPKPPDDEDHAGHEH